MHIMLSLETGGLENGVVNLINHMNPDLFEVSVCCLRKMGNLSERIERSRRKVWLINNGGENSIPSIFRLIKLFKNNKVDIVHTHGWATLLPGFVSAKLSEVPIVINGEHGILIADKKRRVIAQKLLFQMVDCNLTVSKDLVSRISRIFNIDKDNFYPIINGVNLLNFQKRSDVIRQKIRSEIGVGKNGFLVGSVGRIVPVKRYDLLIDAIELLLREGSDVYLTIIGDGPLKTALQNRIAQKELENRVFLLGRKENVADFLTAMDIFVLSSDFEGISNTILEAMTSSLPIVATRVGGTPEIVDDNRTGLLCEPNDINSLASSLARLITDNNLREKMGLEARQDVEARFSLNRMVREYEDIYLKLAKSKSLI